MSVMHDSSGRRSACDECRKSLALFRFIEGKINFCPKETESSNVLANPQAVPDVLTRT